MIDAAKNHPLLPALLKAEACHLAFVEAGNNPPLADALRGEIDRLARIIVQSACAPAEGAS